MKTILLTVATVLLVAASVLAFHDIYERHTVRDWMTLGAAVSLMVYFASEYMKKSPRSGR